VNIKILESAVHDLHAGRIFYERQAKGVGATFFDSLFSDIDSLVIYAGIHPKYLGYHRLLAARFPYAIYYRLENEDAIVFRILDLRQDPSNIRKALS